MKGNRMGFMSMLWLALVAGPGCGSGGGPEPSPAERPNIILMFADDLGYGDLGCYGNTQVQTPHIDRLAAEGIRLTDFYVTAPACTPSRSGLLTGRYPHRNGLYDMIRNDMVNYRHQYTELEYAHSEEMNLGLDLREITIAQLLKEGGYATGIVGKWDSGRAYRFLPLQRGFDFFYGFANTGIDYWTHERYGIPSLFRGNQRIRDEGYATDLFRREALLFLEEHRDRPFFLYLPFNAPHSPSNFERTGPQAPDEYIRLYGEPPGDNRIRYWANISCLDAAVGAVLDWLKEAGLEEKTLVVFSSDNGGLGESNRPLRGRKGGTYEGGIRVPFLARWPGQIPPGTVSHAFTSTLDLFPTFLAVAGLSPPPGLHLDGYNLLPVLTAQAQSSRESHFWEFQGKRAARVGNWKWVADIDNYQPFPEDFRGELYDLSRDISESQDLASEYPEILKKVRSRWEAWMQEMAQAEFRGPFSKAYFELLGFSPSPETP